MNSRLIIWAHDIEVPESNPAFVDGHRQMSHISFKQRNSPIEHEVHGFLSCPSTVRLWLMGRPSHASVGPTRTENTVSSCVRTDANVTHMKRWAVVREPRTRSSCAKFSVKKRTPALETYIYIVRRPSPRWLKIAKLHYTRHSHCRRETRRQNNEVWMGSNKTRLTEGW